MPLAVDVSTDLRWQLQSEFAATLPSRVPEGGINLNMEASGRPRARGGRGGDGRVLIQHRLQQQSHRHCEPCVLLMECQNCELKQRHFYCENCLKQHLLSYRTQISHVAAERDGQVKAANKSLTTTMEPARLRRADLRAREERVREIWDGLDMARKANETTRERIQTKRDNLAARRRMLAIASSPDSFPSSSSSSTSSSPAPHASHSPPNRGLFGHRRLSSTPPVQGTPTTSRPPSSARQGHMFPNVATQIVRSVSVPHHQNPGYLASGSSPPAIPGAFPVQRGHTPSRVEHPRDLATQIEEAQSQLAQLSDLITRARSGLVQELVEVFSVVEVGGRPPLGGKAGTKGEWTIGGLVLPVPGDIRRYPPDHINAVITHTLHFLSVLSFYLGVKLPFDWVWSRSSTPPMHLSPNSSDSRDTSLLGVGTPWIGAIRGNENGGWARWSTKHPLHVSANPAPSSSSPTSSPSSPARPTIHLRSVSSPVSSRDRSAPPESPVSMDDSQIEEPVSTSASGSSFTTALAMLLYDVCYLAHTQGIDVSLAQAGEVLGNLWAVCCSPELGRKSHATLPPLPAPTPSHFPLDFAQLLQATATNPTRVRARGKPGKELRPGREKDTIIEEEEGWDLVHDISV